MLGWTKELYIECNTEWQVMMLENVYRPGRLWHSLDLLCTLFFFPLSVLVGMSQS
jgi:hypothetical protein